MALKDYSNVVNGSLSTYSNMVQGELSRGDRIKVKTMITIEVHIRDGLGKMVAENVESANSFAWQSSLKYRWDADARDCFVNICDAEFQYSYEYVGNCGRLVITPLTDRCYITLTQALRLVMGGAVRYPRSLSQKQPHPSHSESEHMLECSRRPVVVVARGTNRNWQDRDD